MANQAVLEFLDRFLEQHPLYRGDGGALGEMAEMVQKMRQVENNGEGLGRIAQYRLKTRQALIEELRSIAKEEDT